MSSSFIPLVLLIALFSCAEGGKNTDRYPVKDLAVRPPAPRTDLAKGVIVLPQKTLTGNRTYSLYLPDSADLEKKYPALIFLDPHADGEAPLQRYRSLADKYGFLLIGSMDMKNGKTMEDASSIVDDLVREAKTRLPVDPSAITLVGFSGGAKAAIAAGTNTAGIAGIVYCGAAFPPNSIPVKIPSLGITATGDMNFLEVLTYQASLDTSENRNSLLAGTGKHEWPYISLFEQAMIWCVNNHCRIRPVCDSAGLHSRENTSLLALRKVTDPYLLEIRLRNHLKSFYGLTDLHAAESDHKELLKSERYKKSNQRMRDGLAREARYRAGLQQAFSTQEISWWKQRLKELRTTPGDPVNSRLLGFVSLGAYTYSRRSLDQQQLQAAGKYLQLYQLADPGNPEWAFLQACLEAEKNDRNGVLENLRTSVRLGMNDADKVRSEPLLSGMLNDPEIAALIRKLER